MVQINSLSKEEVEEYRKKYIKEDKEKKDKSNSGTPNRLSIQQDGASTPTSNTTTAESTTPVPTTTTSTQPSPIDASAPTSTAPSPTATPSEPTATIGSVGEKQSEEIGAVILVPSTIVVQPIANNTNDEKKESESASTSEKEKPFTWVMNNYFSIGMSSLHLFGTELVLRLAFISTFFSFLFFSFLFFLFFFFFFFFWLTCRNRQSSMLRFP
jgi:hypothetical protein